ncbi:AraC-like DNA-binding protein [Anaerotaenia torta]|uniref:AraC family transcriptional regulator n=1 Tax=Anaerotaenia torta TaxID=433293 RepID=UPI003D1FB2F8
MDSSLLDQLREITAEEQDILDGRAQINKELYMERTSSVIDNRKLMESGKLIRVRTHTRFVHFPKHTHNFVEVIYMCEGETVHIINNEEEVRLKKGELLFLNQNATQEILPAGLDDIAVNFIILPEFFDKALLMIGEEENLIRDFIIGCLRSEEDKVSFLHFKVSDVLPIQNLVENLIWTIRNNQQNNRSINQVTMGLLFLQLMNHTDKVEVGKNRLDQEVMLIVLRYIEENYKDGQLAHLAKELHYNVYWLSRKIKKMTDKTYIELVQSRRLNQAAYLLTTTGMTVADIGMAVGYDNMSYFHRIFKEKYGLSPKEYRDCK